jgi:ABC-2 type transport system ATP-binding protein
MAAATLAAKRNLYPRRARISTHRRGTVLALVAEAKSGGKTIVFSSHVLSEVEEACDRVVILRAGRLVHTQIVSELRQQHRIVAALTAPLPPVPEDLHAQLNTVATANGNVVFETPGELAPLLMARHIAAADVRIEPDGAACGLSSLHSNNLRLRP